MSKLHPICIIGAGGHGRVLAAQMRSHGWTDICFADSALFGSDPLIRFANIEDCSENIVIVAIGDNQTRKALHDKAVDLGFSVKNFIANENTWFGRSLGSGSMVFEGAIVTNDVVIGNSTIVNSGAIIEHDCVIGDYCHIAPGAVVSGGCFVGNNVLIGANATILPGLTIVDNVIIGAGAVVTSSIMHEGVFVGVPAKQYPIDAKGL